VVHDDCIAWTDADTARKGIALDEAARRADVLYLAECALRRDSAEGSGAARPGALPFTVERVPRTGPGREAEKVTLSVTAGRSPRGAVTVMTGPTLAAGPGLGVALALGGAWHAVLILVFLVAVLWADEIAHASARALSAALGAARERVQQRRELDRRWLELGRPSRPVPSAHEYTEDVRDLAGTLVARLCPECEAQLPPDFEVLKGTNDAGPRPRRGGPGGRPAGTGLAAKEESAREARRARPPADSGATAGARPGAGQLISCPVRAWAGRWSCGMPTGTRSPSAPSTAR
jgi:hypothetical protein